MTEQNASFVCKREDILETYKQAHKDLSQDKLDEKIKNKEAFLFGHSLSSQINGHWKPGLFYPDFMKMSTPHRDF